MLNRSSNVAVFENTAIEAESQIYMERELILGENLLQIYRALPVRLLNTSD